jgi:hypothetical protein
MKRSIVLALMLTAALTASAAQEAGPRLSMWNRGVFNLYSTDGTTSLGPNWMGYAVDQGPYNSLVLDWSGKDVTWSMTAQWDGDAQVYPIYLYAYSGSFTMFDGFMRLTAGKVSSNEYRFRNFDTTGFSTRIANAETGLLLQVFPVKGLSVGAFLPVPVSAQGVAITYAHTNFGIQWTPSESLVFKASLRLEPASSGNREASVGASIVPFKNSTLTIGYTYRDVTQENDLFLDGSCRLGDLSFHAFADGGLIAGSWVAGGKLNAEYSLPKTPFTLGASASYGNGDAWGISGLDLNPYIRYGFSGSSVQVGTDVTYGTSWAAKLQLAYTVGF